MVLPPSFAPKERRKQEVEKREAAERLKDEQQQISAAERAKKIAKKALEEKAKTKQLTSDDFDEAREHAQQLANDIYTKMKEAESAKEAVQRLASSSKRSKRREVTLRPSDSSAKSNPAESVSEAIANKLHTGRKPEVRKTKRGMKDTSTSREVSRDTKRKTGRPPQSEAREKKPSTAVERRQPESKKNQDTKERSGHKVHTRPSEVRRQDIESKKPKDDHKTPRDYKVRMFDTVVKGKRIKTGRDLLEFIDKELPGMKHLPYFDKIVNDAIAHIKLKELIGDKTELKLREIKSLSKQTDLPLRTTRHYVYKEGQPQFYRLTEKAITKSDAKSIIDRLHSNLGDIRSHSDVEKRLREKGLLEHLQKLSQYERDNGMVYKYFKFLHTFSEGGLMRDIARRVGAGEGTCIQWTKGVLPLHIKRIIDTPDQPKHDASTSMKEKSSQSVTDNYHQSRIKMKPGEVQGVSIVGEKQLMNIITNEYPGIMDMPGFDKMLHEAYVHIHIMNHLQGKDFLRYGEVSKLAKEYNVKRGTLSIWTTKGVTPRLYVHINRSVSRLEAREKLNWIREKNNGVVTKAEYDRRFNNYYLFYLEQSASFHKRENDVAHKYLKFLEFYQLGGPLNHIARKAGVAPSTSLGWLEGNQPRRIRIASAIPESKPEEGQHWLPLSFRNGKYPENFVQVPEKVESYKDILLVLQNLKSIESDYVRELNQRYSRRSIEEEFMYLLGAYMSDGSTFNRTPFARSFGIRLSRTYPWSYDFGEGMCQSLNACGIFAHRIDNTPANTTFKKTEDGVEIIRQNEKYNWNSENSPLLHWMHRSCLGYKEKPAKRDQPATAKWILDAPIHMRKSVLQGLGDGDGSASVQGNYICISSKSNKPFIEKLLQSFGVNTRITKKDVFTSGMMEAKKAAQIPPFRYAKTRLEAAERIIERIDAKRKVREHPLTREEIEFLLSLKERGMTAWAANEAFFDKYGDALNPKVVKRIFRKSSQ